MKIFSIVGARPQFIKAAPLSRVLRQQHIEILMHTGQHYDRNMSGLFFEELEIPQPDYNLNVGSASHGKQTGAILAQLDDLLQYEKPDWVLVYGDTNSTLAGALAAVKLHIPVAHVEAGLRSFNRAMPEEINRVVTDHVSDLLLCPTETAVKNLAKEGVIEGVHNVGDVMYDAVLHNLEIARQRSQILPKLNLTSKEYLLATVHRAENTDDEIRLRNIFGAFTAIDETIVLPLHPRTAKMLQAFGLHPETDNLKLIDPVSYLDMLVLIQNARQVLTDSGGLQKEAYFLATPCITLRDETEWVETLNKEWNVLVGADWERIIAAIQRTQPIQERTQPFGVGTASEKISRLLIGLHQK